MFLLLCLFQSAAAVADLLVHPRFGSRGCQQQRALLRHCLALPHAALCHHLHRILQVEDEQDSGLHHVPALLYLPGPQRHVGGPHHRLSRLHLKVTLHHAVSQRLLVLSMLHILQNVENSCRIHSQLSILFETISVICVRGFLF